MDEVRNMSSDVERRDGELDLAAALEKTAEEIAEEYYCKLWDFLDQLGICELTTNFPIPPESWKGIAQGLADVSGYRVVLQRAVMESCADNSGGTRVIDYQAAIVAEPMLFIRTTEE
jgi:hypothetical protein